MRIGLGRLLTAAGAILVIISLPMVWYHADRAVNSNLTGWSVFTNLRIWLVVASVLALGTVVYRRGTYVVVARAVLGLAVGAPVLRRIISPPDASVHLDDRVGLYIALVGAIAIIAGGLLSAGREAAEAMGWDLPGFSNVRALPPPGPRPSGHGAARPLPSSDEVIDGHAVEEHETPI